YGHAAADDLRQGGDVGGDAGQALNALRTGAKACHYLVKYQQGAMFGAEFAQAFQEPRDGFDEVHVSGNGFDDDAGDLVAKFVECGFNSVEAVEIQDQGVLDEFAGNAGGSGVAEGKHAGTGLDEKAVGMAVVAAFEFDDLGPAGKAPGQAERGHGSLCARADQRTE